LPILKGTSLITLATDAGVVMVADDLVYYAQSSVAIPAERNVRKVFAMGNNILIGTAEIMRAVKSGQLIGVGETPQTIAIKYKFEDWIIEFIRGQRNVPDNDPKAIANALHAKMRETFKPVEVFLEHGCWGDHSPGDRLVNYIVAGYAKNFKYFQLFEFGAEFNPEGNGLRYIVPISHETKLPKNLFLGEDKFIQRALAEQEPEAGVRMQVWSSCVASATAVLPNIPEALQDAIASAVSLVKVEAKFNPDKVGDIVNVAVIDRRAKRHYLANF
jgi:hypothetical protein